jgi:hypothetical protein
MFPSPSEGPPWLSESPSPAFAPCGIPFELDPEAELVAPAPPDELAGCELEVCELEEFPPHAATPRTTSTIIPAARRRIDFVFSAIIEAPLLSAQRADLPIGRLRGASCSHTLPPPEILAAREGFAVDCVPFSRGSVAEGEEQKSIGIAPGGGKIDNS